MDLKQAYRALDPAHPLEPDSPFYTPRPDNPVSLIVTELQLTDVPRRYLLAGHRGSGKTTELRRIASALNPEQTVLSIDFGPGQTIERAVSAAIARSVQKGQLRRHFPQPTASDSPLTEMLKDAVGVRSLLRSLSQRVVVLIDGVDKLDSYDVQDALKAIGALAAWPIGVVCTIPLTTMLERNFGQAASAVDAWHFLPGISLWTQAGAAIESGWKLCRRVLQRRTDVFSEKALDVIVENSAGIHRELLRIAQRACVLSAASGKERVFERQANRAVRELRNEYSVMLRSEDHSRLREVERTGRISGDPNLLRLVRDQFIVAYGSGGAWFDIHPIVRPLVVDDEDDDDEGDE